MYFKINSRVKGVITATKKVKLSNVVIKKRSITWSLIRKELNTFFTTPVFIVNAGFALVLFVLAVLYVIFRFDGLLLVLAAEDGFNMPKEMVLSHLPIFIFVLIIL